LYGHSDDTLSVAFSPDGKKLVSTSQDNDVRVWDTDTGTCLLVLQGHTDASTTAVFSPDGKMIATGGIDRKTCLWNSRTGKLIRVFKDGENSGK
ncbi:MAG: PD40 domain-containing protein, partial [Candidatus Eremiobacteraeota bacterium]|nr:PD40 domain-containing protein [Candidatus Eremiobacteraeota bacterium]